MTRRPRSVLLNAPQVAAALARKLPPAHQAQINASFGAALNAFICGRRCEVHWGSLVDAMNVGEALADLGICSDADSKARIAGGLQVLGAVMERSNERRTWTLHAAEIEALREALWLHAVQLQLCSLGEYEQAIRKVIERTRQALAGNVARGVVVVEAPRP